MTDLCRRCDVFIGWGGAGVVIKPEDRDEAWLSSHCWMCGRSRDEIQQAESEGRK